MKRMIERPSPSRDAKRPCEATVPFRPTALTRSAVAELILPELADLVIVYIGLHNEKILTNFILYNTGPQQCFMDQSEFIVRLDFAMTLWKAVQHEVPPSADLLEAGLQWGPCFPDTSPVHVRATSFLSNSNDIGSYTQMSSARRVSLLQTLQKEVKIILGV
jgi:hypothetical protein